MTGEECYRCLTTVSEVWHAFGKLSLPLCHGEPRFLHHPFPLDKIRPSDRPPCAPRNSARKGQAWQHCLVSSLSSSLLLVACSPSPLFSLHPYT